MSALLERRRRQLRAKGRQMELSHVQGSGSVSVLGYSPPPTAATLSDGVAKQRLVIQITNDEISKRPDFAAPHKGDRVKDGGKLYIVTDCSAVFDKNSLIGWVLIVDGGQ